MTREPFVALLRGINVGGRNRLPMANLRATLDAAGFGNVQTYIQSGNVVFDAPGATSDEAELATAIGAAIDVACGLAVPVLVRSLGEIVRVAGSHPDSGGGVPDKWLHVFFMDGVIVPEQAPDPARFSPDRWVVDGREVYVTYPEGAGRSRLTIDVMERSFGVTATARNVSTLAAISALGDRR
jgi:uncharacterized protein (DUF1697 family)